MLTTKLHNAAEKVAYNYITRGLHPVLREPVEGLLAKGWGVSEFGTRSTTMVREGLFGDKRLKLQVGGDEACTIARV